MSFRSFCTTSPMPLCPSITGCMPYALYCLVSSFCHTLLDARRASTSTWGITSILKTPGQTTVSSVSLPHSMLCTLTWTHKEASSVFVESAMLAGMFILQTVCFVQILAALLHLGNIPLLDADSMPRLLPQLSHVAKLLGVTAPAVCGIMKLDLTEY